MSVCERDRLGYDPTLYYNGEEHRWETKVYDDSTDAHKTFELVSCMRISDRVCGRHICCFDCKEIKPSGDIDEHGKPAAEPCGVLVKSAWVVCSFLIMKEIMDERRHEAEYIAKHAVRKDVDSLFSLVEPKKTAKTIVDPIVEATLTTINNGFSALSRKSLDAVIGKDELKKYGDSFDLDRAVESTFRLSKLNEELFRGVSEADMYPLFRDFVMLVAHHVKAGAERFIAERSVKPKGKRKKISGAIEPVLILPYNGGDFKPEGSDDRTKIDGALALCELPSPIEPQGSPNYKDIFAIGELKRWERDSLQAFTQLAEYTRNIYANQDHRRFAWGLTMCGTKVRGCLFHHDGVRATSTMDFASHGGREKLVTLLVHWSFCSFTRLGYDTNMTRLREENAWEIRCPNHDNDGKRNSFTSYVTTRTIVNASSLFGRHTRCYIARRKDDTSGMEVVLKDSWSLPRDLKKQSAISTVPNEARNLQLIKEKFAGENLNFSYPQVVTSSRAKLSVGGKYIIDDTLAIYEYDDGDEEQIYRVRSLIVTTPVGRFIKRVKNEAELVLVLSDAMECHNAILKKCGLLHRDISVNNILVITNDGDDSLRRPVKGLLIDYDHAISVDQDSTGNGTRSGTLPYMSIHNLEGAPGKRSALDDWESLLYLICWLGTFGINSKDRDNINKKKTAEIEKWRHGTMQDIAECKRRQMNSMDTFSGLILAGFQEEYNVLKLLATKIYMALFQHDGCKGAYFDTEDIVATDSFTLAFADMLNEPQGDQSSSKQPKSDPLVVRKEYEKEIVDDLLKAIRAAAAASEDFFLQKAIAQGNETAPNQ
ncbi:hypothetical protein IW138_006439 [Coemansia sp. RSA 986]|nr:hypothetical protein IW138_006439 [Coemansia sp. RSA 986]